MAVLVGASFAVAQLTSHGADPASTGNAAPATQLPAMRATPVTAFAGLTAAAGEPELPSLKTLRPRAGTAVPAPGPFDSRLQFTSLGFDGAAVHAKVRVTSDVSDLLDFSARAGFYDASGRLIGTGTWTYHLDEAQPDGQAATTVDGHPNELEAFRVPVPANVKGRAVSAAVGVTVLVNE
ncbi:hypothetical protein GCM10009858_47160 [Terrabacter carboxydivorans]|uniref:Uncharacterized protein n=1 Tax=Terrabacter carboxydivorans TaxID=619730 RepID=A0ABN3ML06_9MICO